MDIAISISDTLSVIEKCERETCDDDAIAVVSHRQGITGSTSPVVNIDRGSDITTPDPSPHGVD